jgi:hypothetical protein
VNTIIDTYNNWKTSKISKKNKLALLLMECRRNLALLEILKLNENGDQINKHLCQVAESLDISVLRNCFMEALNGDDSILQELNDMDIIVDTEKNNGKPEKLNAIDAACFIHQRTIIIQSVANLGLDFQEQHRIRFRSRLKNLEKNFQILAIALKPSTPLI